MRVAEELCRIVDNQPLSTGVLLRRGVAPTRLRDQFDTPAAAVPAGRRRASTAPSGPGCAHTRSSPAALTEVDVPEEAPVDRRARRGRLHGRQPAVLESGFEVLDRLRGCTVQTRLEAVADHVLLLLDGAAWWVSHVTRGATRLVSVAARCSASPRTLDASGIAQSEIGAHFPLDDFPASRAAIRDAAAFLVELGARPGPNDPAEEQSLVTAGYTGVLAAGATAPAAGGWSRSTATRSACRSPASSRCCDRWSRWPSGRATGASEGRQLAGRLRAGATAAPGRPRAPKPYPRVRLACVPASPTSPR